VGAFTAGADTNPSITISGSPFSYDSGNGNLLVEIFGLDQSNLCNGCGNSYMSIDNSGTVMGRAANTTTPFPSPAHWSCSDLELWALRVLSAS